MLKLLFLLFKAFCNVALNSFTTCIINHLSCLCAIHLWISSPLNSLPVSRSLPHPTFPHADWMLHFFLCVPIILWQPFWLWPQAVSFSNILYLYSILQLASIFTNTFIIYLGGFYSYFVDNSGSENCNLSKVTELIFGKLECKCRFSDPKPRSYFPPRIVVRFS